ncbi:MAG: hypothetical protein IT201_07315 [Thermoleophilia bacterium]|nr:hypothetical protein [Thermoleophilia bacterium]
MPGHGAKVPADARVALLLEATREVVELSAEESRAVLQDDPDLLHEYLKWRGTTRTRGRLIVIDPQLVSAILARVETGRLDAT